VLVAGNFKTMKSDFLKEGDVINIENGMKVYTQIADMFIYQNSLSDKLSSHDVIVGATYTNEKSENHLFNSKNFMKDIIEEIVRKCENNGLTIEPKKVFDFIKQNAVKPDLKTFILEGGEFVVIKTSYEGGGTGHGQYDVYPNGHCVYCKKLKGGKFDINGIEINFYQSGCFTAMIENITPIRKMQMNYE
jgi:hypothetical protein